MPPTLIDPHRPEIEARTAAGESCEQVAAALRANGFEVSAKTISRWRVAWGLRKRKAGTVGRKYPDRKRRVTADDGQPRMGKHQAQELRKSEIIERTKRGETADQIAQALIDQGWILKSGASAIWRLQTTWGLIPFDPDRARGKGKWNKKRQAQEQEAAAAGFAEPRKRRPRTKATPIKRAAQMLAPSNPSETLHYPPDCSNGPNSRPYRSQPGIFNSNLPDSDSEPDHMPMIIPDESAHNPPVNLAAELMSAELLVDLATSTLAAANRVKELYLAQQMQQPVPGSNTGRPPSEEDVQNAKKKVREAAAVMHDLAMPNIHGGD